MCRTDEQRAPAPAAPRARTQWGTASPGGLLAESHVNFCANELAPSQGASVNNLRAAGAR